MIWPTVRSRSGLQSFSIFGCKEYNQSDFGSDHLAMTICSLLLCCWESVFAMTSAFFWQNSANLCPASFCIQGQTFLLIQVSLDFLLLHSNPLMMKSSSLLVLEGVVRLHRTGQLQLFQHQFLGHRLGLLWYWMICLGNKQRSFCCFWDCTQVLHFRLCC